ncbi:ribosomal protection-like ABC-F family protein [Candidatus Bipolaricaulota bacterium]
MTLLQIERLTKAFGTDILFEPFSAQVARGDRIALIGDNGVGKSTLLHLLRDAEAPTDGTVRRIGTVRVVHLPQVARLQDEGTLWEAMERPFAPLRQIEKRLRELEQTMATANSETLHNYDELLHRFDHEGGYQIDARIRSALHGVGFTEAKYTRSVGTLSGGEEARAALARTLLESPDVVLLDEPTNHLDFAALDWLEEQLLSFSGALVLVSHDRHLLERVTNRTWEIALQQVSVYRVGYAHSREVREAERERQLATYDKQEETIERYRDFVRRNKAGQKVRQAKDRERKLERIERDRVERPRDAKRITLRIRSGRPSGKRVFSMRDLAVGFDRPLFACPEADLYRGEKVAIIGPNGCGKTTLLRTIAGEHPPIRGEIDVGHNVHPATYNQTQEGLHGTNTVLEAILSRSALTISEARGLLGRFLFSGEDVDKKMTSLSGGERSRIALALLSLVEGNLLLFDEPTNHLDLASQEILEAALVAYDGTILLVSHDRALLEAVTTQTWIVEGDTLRVHGHGYTEYRRRRAASASEDASERSRPRKERRSGSSAKTSRRQQGRKQERETEERKEAERAIESLESRIADLEASLIGASERGDAGEIGSLGAEHKAAVAELEARYALWEQLAASAEMQDPPEDHPQEIAREP